MHNSYDIIAIVSKAEEKIYFIDFSTLKGIYKKFELKEIEHPAQITYGYLVPLCNIKAHGGLLGEICYS